MENYHNYLRYKPVYLLLILTSFASVIFFDIYRGAAFNVIPHDDYAIYLLHILSEDGGKAMGSPFYYRVISVLLAAPFYYILPTYKFTNLGQLSAPYLKAVEALSFVTFLAILVSSIMIYLISKRRLGQSEEVSLIASLLSLLLFRYTALYGVDPTAIMMISIIIYYFHNKTIFTILILLSIGVNEKIILLFVMLGLSRNLFSNRKSLWHAAVPVTGFAIYLVIRQTINVAGCEHQLEPLAYAASFYSVLLQTLTLKGIVLNILPTGIVVILYVLALFASRKNNLSGSWYFQPSDILPLIGIFLIAHIVRAEYNVGRLSMYCFPFYLPLASSFFREE